MTTIKPADTQPLIPRTDSQVRRKEEVATLADGEAVQFDRSSSSFAQMFQVTMNDVEASRAADVARIKQQVADGTYEPDLQTIAERMLSHTFLGAASFEMGSS